MAITSATRRDNENCVKDEAIWNKNREIPYVPHGLKVESDYCVTDLSGVLATLVIESWTRRFHTCKTDSRIHDDA